ncbi:MAG: SUMF1/EgtB/PvdO family nonheme iron enzyme, partial [Nitrospirae bacterium]|nr:SUMF1/EgtB/PvdO family nonheme iron enzyme [Nitrospirota bacterium]
DKPRPDGQLQNDGKSSGDQSTEAEPSSTMQYKNQTGSLKSKQLESAKSREAVLNNAALKKELDYGGPDKQTIERLLHQGDFPALEKIYEKILQQYKLDVQYELYFIRAYDLLRLGVSVTSEDLDLWVSKTGSYIAYTARGVYKAVLGFNARGTKYISETPARDLERMQRFHEEAAKDLQIAITKNPFVMPAYDALEKMARASDMPFTSKQILQKAEAIDNRIFYIRFQYMRSLQPRWGGSHQQMKDYAKSVVKYADLNPRIWSLQGDVYADIADGYFRDDNYEAAVESYTAALMFGDRTDWLRARAACYYRLGQQEPSHADLRRVLYYEPSSQSTQIVSKVGKAPTNTAAVSSMEFVSIKGGCFNMGNTFGDFSIEKPVHQVCLNDFSIGKYPVTRDQWNAVMGSERWSNDKCGGNCPATVVSWNEVQEFIGALNKQTGKKYRLLTEAEWEYAARSGGKDEKWAGTNNEAELRNFAWYKANSGPEVHPVGKKRPNGLGIHDMGGNVMEWVSDWHDDNYYSNSQKDNPQGPSYGSKRVKRGGCWIYNPWNIRVTRRFSDDPASRSADSGFRLAQPLP